MKRDLPAALVLLLAGICQAAEQRPARIVVEPTAFDFGKVLQGRTLTKEFAVRNVGGKDLVVERVAADCGCTVASFDLKPLKPGESRPLKVDLRTGSYLGRIVKTVRVQSRDSKNPLVTIRLEAVVEDDVSGANKR